MTVWTVTEPQRLDVGDVVHRLSVMLVQGQLNIVGTDGPARVEIASVGTEELHVKIIDGVLRIEHEWPRGWTGLLTPIWWWLHGRRRFKAEVSVAVPYDVAADVKVISGAVLVSTLHGDLNVDCTSGRVTLLGVAGETRAKMVSGPIEALGCAGDIHVETVSGEITLADSAAGRLSARTISGSVTADLDNPPHDSHIFLDTTSGHITVRVRPDSDLSVHLHSVSGRVTSAFPGIVSRDRYAGSAPHVGVLGDGAGQLRARAVSGGITLLNRPVDEDFDAGDQS